MRGVILSEIIQFVLGLAILSCTFAALLKYLPHGPLLGGTLSWAAPLLTREASTHTATASAFSTAGSLAVLLMWLYFAAMVPLIQIRPSAV